MNERTPKTDPGRSGGLKLRLYQQDVARAIVDSVLQRRGLSFVVMFPRQSGKNELQAQVEACLLALLAGEDAEIIKVSPTWRPQSINAMRRLQRVLERNPYTAGQWTKENGYIFRLGRARIFFLSGAPESNIVGATASTLLEVDEAQDVTIAKFDRDIGPMAASTNATRVFWGTAWTSQTLLARELRAARNSGGDDSGRDDSGTGGSGTGGSGTGGSRTAPTEDMRGIQPDDSGRGHWGHDGSCWGGSRTAPTTDAKTAPAGIQTTFVLTADDVAREVPDYGKFVAGQIAKLGRSHVMVRTQFFSEEIDGQDGMFPPARIALMQGAHPEQIRPTPGRVYAILLDVAGEDESASPLSASASFSAEAVNAKRDSTALTIVEVDLATRSDPLLRAPTYRVMGRRIWTGEKHTALYGQIRALVDLWQARHVVVDATGIGAGLASFLENTYPNKVHPFVFSAQSKSQLGWDFLAVVDSGRWKEPAGVDPNAPSAAALFLRQLAFTQSTVQPGPGRLMRWGVPDGSRDPATGEWVHDDLMISAALCAVLDRLPWPAPTSPAPGVIRGKDPLEGMTGF